MKKNLAIPGVCGSLKWKFCLWYLDLINETPSNPRRTRVFRKRFHYALFFRAFNWIRERTSQREKDINSGIFSRGGSPLRVPVVSPMKMNFSVEKRENRAFTNFSHCSARWSCKSPAIAELRCRKHGRTTRKSSRRDYSRSFKLFSGWP